MIYPNTASIRNSKYPNHSAKAYYQNPENIFVFFILAIGVVLRLYHLDHQSFWRDELLTMFHAQKSAKEIIFLNEDYPPLYNLVLHFLLFFGSGEFIARLPSVIFGSGSIILIYALTKKIFNSQIAILSSILLAVNPLHIWYSQEARMYSIWIFFSLGSVYYFYSIFENKEEIRKQNNIEKILFCLFSILSLYTCLYTIFLLFFQFLYLFFQKEEKKVILSFCFIIGIVLLFFIPYLIIYINNLINEGRPFGDVFEKEFSILYIPYTILCFSLGTSYGPSTAELHFNRSIQMFLSYPSFPLATAVFGIIFLSGLSYVRKSNSFLLFSLYFLVPFLFPVIVHLVFKSIPYNVRHAIIALPPCLIIMACGLKRLCFNTGAVSTLNVMKKYILLFFFVYLILHSLYNHFFDPKYYKSDIRNAAIYIEKNEIPGEKLLILPSNFIEFRHYYQGTSEIVKELEGEEQWVVLMREWEYPMLEWNNYYREKKYIELPGVKIYKLEKIKKN